MVLRRIHGKVDIYQINYGIHSKLRLFPYSEVIHGSTTFKLTKGYKKVKEKLVTIQFDVFVLSFNKFVLLTETISAINGVGACYFLHASS